ncbi:MAG: type II toxin-antitoxin system HicB family antitoxin [Planctomycetes bacterium]|nr:type II toxin-antitoxin system HicB family antitoxin [Planctomycetota bacterium]
MATIKDQCVYTVGPYRGYCGRAQYDAEAGLFHGEVLGVRDVITFQGKTPRELKTAFSDSVDDYLELCASRKESPEKPFSGKLLTRMEPELHKKISMAADLSGLSLNQFICDSLHKAVDASLARPGVRGKSTPGTAHSREKSRGSSKRSKATADVRPRSKAGDTRRRSKSTGIVRQ